jgi:exopolyphosphatase/guanosine-5'-triphosphate,3'-diphosphate pyrophosphatase
MKLAVIDIGSNAIRLQIVRAFVNDQLVSFKKLEYLRFPLRLGHDVFKKGRISVPVLDKLAKLMQTFKLLIDLYEVEGYSAVATSAMREAENGEEISDFIFNQIGLQINVISGDEEGKILNKAIIPTLQDSNYIHIDVGGGSTELNIFDGRKLLEGRSFKMGSVRQLTKTQQRDTLNEIKEWIKRFKFDASESVIGIGTGGNINKIFNLKYRPTGNQISLAEFKALRAYLNAFSLDDKMSILKMNPDRADVIIPAADIYIRVMEYMGSDQIVVPKVGLKDGLVYELYERLSQKSLTEIEFL